VFWIPSWARIAVIGLVGRAFGDRQEGRESTPFYPPLNKNVVMQNIRQSSVLASDQGLSRVHQGCVIGAPVKVITHEGAELKDGEIASIDDDDHITVRFTDAEPLKVNPDHVQFGGAPCKQASATDMLKWAAKNPVEYGSKGVAGGKFFTPTLTQEQELRWAVKNIQQAAKYMKYEATQAHNRLKETGNEVESVQKVFTQAGDDVDDLHDKFLEEASKEDERRFKPLEKEVMGEDLAYPMKEYEKILKDQTSHFDKRSMLGFGAKVAQQEPRLP